MTRYGKPLIKWISLASMVAAGIIGIVCFKADVTGLLAFFAFILCYVQLPGMWISDVLGLAGNHLSTRLARGFFAGFALQILLFFVADLLGTNLILTVGGPVFALLGVIRFIRLRGKNGRSGSIAAWFSGIPAGAFLFAAIVFLYALNTTQFTYISPAFTEYSSIRLDFEYHCGIMNALAQGYPAQNPWVDGRLMQYHYFTEMLYAIPMRLFGLTSESILLSYAPYLVTAVLSVSLYSFFREMMRRADRIGLYMLALAGANMFMVKSFASSWFLFHIISNINNASFGICCLLITIPILSVWDRAQGSEGLTSPKRGCWKEGIFLVVMTMLMTGIKGPVGVVFVGAAFGTVILGLFFGRKGWRLLGTLAVCAAGFLLIYVFIIGGGNSNSSGGSLINIGEVTDIAYFKDPLMDMVSGMGLPSSAGKLVLLAVFLVFYFTSFIIPFVVGYIRELILVLGRKKPFLTGRVCVYAACMVGFLGMMILNYSGHSQVYFGFITSVFVPAVAFWFFEDFEGSKGFLIRLVRVLFAVGMICSSATLALHLGQGILEADEYYKTQNEQHNKYRGVSAAEYDGLIWLRENTDEDDLIASDRYYSVNPKEYDYTVRWDSVHFAYAVYSQRRQYLEGTGFSLDASENDLRREMIETNARLYDPKNDERGELARDLSVDYVVVSKRFDHVKSLANEDYTLCYQNSDMDIYQVVD